MTQALTERDRISHLLEEPSTRPQSSAPHVSIERREHDCQPSTDSLDDEKRIDEKANQHEPGCARARGFVECLRGGCIESNRHIHLLLTASELAVALPSPTTNGGQVYLSFSVAYNRFESVTIHRRHQRGSRLENPFPGIGRYGIISSQRHAFLTMRYGITEESKKQDGQTVAQEKS
jgi:hypothetical protein